MFITYVITQGEIGGAQKNVLNLALATKSRGDKVIVITGQQKSKKDNWLFDELKKGGFEDKNLISVKLLRRDINIINTLLDLLAFFSFLFLFLKQKPDIIHSHSSKAGLIASITGKLSGAKTVYTAHGFVFSEPMPVFKKVFYLFMEFTASFFRDLTITVSEFDKNIGLKFKVVSDKKSIVIYNGINPNEKEKIISKQAARQFINHAISADTSDHFLVGAIANLYKTKGLEYLINAAAILQKQFSNKFIFTVFGEGELRPILEKLIKEKKLTDIFFLPGSLPDAYQYLRGFDLLVLPSVKEGFPYVILESLLAATPVLATAVGGVPEVNKYASIELVLPQNVNQLTEKIKSSSTNPKPFSRPLPEIFTAEHMTNQTLSQYKKLLS